MKHVEAMGYTAGPAPLKYLGLGDLTVESSEVTRRMDPKNLETSQEGKWETHDQPVVFFFLNIVLSGKPNYGGTSPKTCNWVV